MGRGGAETKGGGGQAGFSAMALAFGKEGLGGCSWGVGGLGLLLAGVIPHLFPGKSSPWTGGTWLRLEPPPQCFQSFWVTRSSSTTRSVKPGCGFVSKEATCLASRTLHINQRRKCLPVLLRRALSAAGGWMLAL